MTPATPTPPRRAPDASPPPDLTPLSNAAHFHERTRVKGVNMLVYRVVRFFLLPFFLIYFRLDRVGREHMPQEGPVIVAANHRSFLDPFILGTMSKRPLYYVSKKELFERRWQGWILNSLGAFPVARGRADEEMLETARAILARGDSLVIFPEGTRTRSGSLARPKRGVGRLALETGAQVIPIAITGTEHVRRGWRIRSRKVRMRAGQPLVFPLTSDPSPDLADAVTA
ncbi:MAG: 1-acyl-sn-glycerol-3-phosphate acyltransferase, partial [Thermoleophilaceae bacterium]|nr:1-acyl-sn-glycerol-3-phosphate acyltransferase [Thermoleophilaceae bacterium]